MLRIAVVPGLIAALLSACAVDDLNLPPPPTAQHPPTVTGFSPTEAHAGTALTVQGTGFGSDPLKLKVQLGNGPSVQATSVNGDGTSLTLQVPQGSTTGAVNVTTSAGVGTSQAEFHYLGAGDLNIGAVTTSVDLRIHVCDVFALKDQSYLASPCDNAGLFAFDIVHIPNRLNDDDQIPLVTVSQDGHWIAYVTQSDWQDEACDNGPAVCLTSHDAAFNDRNCLCLPKDDTFNPGDIAWDAASQRVLLRSDQHLSIVDWTDATHPQLTSVLGPFSNWPDAHADWLDASHVVVGTDATLHRLDAATLTEDGEPVTVPVGTFSVDLGQPSILHGLRVAPNTLVAVSDSFLSVYDASVWPPMLRQQLPPTDYAFSGTVELTGDGRYLAGMEQADGLNRNRVLLYDLSSGRTLPIQSVLVTHAVGMHLSPAGTFIVAGLGGATEIAPESGNVLGMLSFPSIYRSMVLHAPEAKESASSVEMLTTTLDIVRRFNSDSLSELKERPPLQNQDGMSRSAQAVSPDGQTTYSISNQSFRVFQDSTGKSAQLNFYPDWLTVGSDGRSVVVYASANRGDPMNPSMQVPPSWTVLDTTKAAGWDSLTPVRFEADEDILVAFSDATQVYVFTPNHVRVFDLQAALAGEKMELPGSPVALPSTALHVLPSPAGFLLDLAGSDESDPSDELQLLSAETLQLSSCGALPVSTGDFDWQLSPEGRHLWLDLATNTSTSLQSYTFDSTTCQLGAVEWDVRLAGDIWQMQVAPTGERLFALDPYQERLFVVE